MTCRPYRTVDSAEALLRQMDEVSVGLAEAVVAFAAAASLTEERVAAGAVEAAEGSQVGGHLREGDQGPRPVGAGDAEVGARVVGMGEHRRTTHDLGKALCALHLPLARLALELTKTGALLRLVGSNLLELKQAELQGDEHVQ